MSLLVSTKLAVGKKRVPLMLELPVNPLTSPYLVTTTRSFHWSSPMKNNLVRVAVRKGNLEDLFSEIVQIIYEQGITDGWGNSNPLSKEGLRSSVEYLKYYGLEDLEILTSKDNPLELGEKFEGNPVRIVSWLKDCCVVVPKDKSFFGSITDFGSDNYAILIHNPSRGISFSS